MSPLASFSRLCYFLLYGFCLLWLTAVISTSDFTVDGSVCKRPGPHAEVIYSRRCVKFSGNSPFLAELPRCCQSLSLMPVSQPASWRENQMFKSGSDDHNVKTRKDDKTKQKLNIQANRTWSSASSVGTTKTMSPFFSSSSSGFAASKSCNVSTYETAEEQDSLKALFIFSVFILKSP